MEQEELLGEIQSLIVHIREDLTAIEGDALTALGTEGVEKAVSDGMSIVFDILGAQVHTSLMLAKKLAKLNRCMVDDDKDGAATAMVELVEATLLAGVLGDRTNLLEGLDVLVVELSEQLPQDFFTNPN